MAQPSKPPREGRIKIEAQLKVADREALDRYCECHNLTITQFVTNRIREYQRKMLSSLNTAQREDYMAGELLWSEMSDDEKDAIRAQRPVVPRLDAVTDERLTRLTKLIGRSETWVIETVIKNLDEDWLATRLTEDEKPRYFAGELRAQDTAWFRKRWGGQPEEPQPKPDDPEQQQLRTLATNPGLREFA